MATTKPPALPPALPRAPRAPRRRRWRKALAIALLAVVALLIWFWAPLTGYAAAGASYGARVACACRHIGGRSLADCRKDFVSGMALVTLSEDTRERRVTARFPLLSRQTARFREGEGCVLETWED